ncbi:MAG TPA: hypothetical protein VF813_01500 [Anaerolineaceae bacterium]
MKLKLQSLKIMLLGLMLMLLGGVITMDTRIHLGGLEYLLIFGGLLLGIVGFWRED